MYNNEEKKTLALKVSNKTNPTSLSTAIVGYLKSRGELFVDCIGVATNYITTKAIINTTATLATMDMGMSYRPILKDYEIEDANTGYNILIDDQPKVRTGIRWILRLENNN